MLDRLREGVRDIELEGIEINAYYDREKILLKSDNIKDRERKNYKKHKYNINTANMTLDLEVLVNKKVYNNSRTIGDLVYKTILKEIDYSNLKEDYLKSKEFNDYIANTLHDAVIVLNKDGYVEYYNDKALEILEAPKEEIRKKPLQEFYSSKLKVMEVLKTGEEVYNEEIFLKPKEGPKKHLLKTILPIKDNKGNVIGVLDKIKEIKTAKNFITNMSGSQASFTFEDIIHDSEEMEEVINLAKSTAKTDMTVLIQGESGTGKELFAHAMHNASNRALKPFVILDCSTIPKELVESELFGYAEGAFTGAKKGGKLGKFDLASEGTIFLDEIGEMPLDMQAKLLRVLQDRTFTRVGGNELIEVDIRIIAATNRNLEEEVRKNNFREDLYYRLNMVSVEIPPLRERKKDIIKLTNHFLGEAQYRLNKKDITINPNVKKIFLSYSWPGNGRELENVIFRAVNLCTGNEINIEYLPEYILENVDIKVKPEESSIDLTPLEKMELEKILTLLKENRGNKKRTAEELGISRSTLYRKLKKYNIKL